MSDYQDLVDKFNSCTLPKDRWTHEAHLIVGIWYCKNYDLPKALDLLRYHIKTYNLFVGTPNSDTQGYHETMTRFWLLIAANFVKSDDTKTFEETAEAFINSDWANRNLAFNYYTKDVIFSVEARKHWVEADLQPIPLSADSMLVSTPYF